jgi:hypothetical protein
LFFFKAVVHWMFGLAINLSFRLGLDMYPPQIFYFSAFSAVTAIFGTYLAFRRPYGCLPATYGHIQTIADIIDDWAPCMFWGHKDGQNVYQVSYAGTSTKELPGVYPNRLYGGVRQIDDVQLAYLQGLQEGSRLASPDPRQAHGGRWSNASSNHTWHRASDRSLNSTYTMQSMQPLMYDRDYLA